MLVTPYCERDRVDPPHGFAGGVRKQLKTYIRMHVSVGRIRRLIRPTLTCNHESTPFMIGLAAQLSRIGYLRINHHAKVSTTSYF